MDTKTFMNIANKTVLMTGANRGVGRALVIEALKRGVKRVYAGTRTPLPHADERVIAVTLDVTSDAQIAQAAAQIGNVDILINNAGIALYDDLSNLAILEQHMAVNCFGPLKLTRALLPLLSRAHGAIVNILSLSSLAPLPVIPAYSISKAAAFNLTQSLRMLLASQHVTVHGVLLGPTDTDINRGFDIPKASPGSVAQRIFDDLEKGEEDIFPDPVSQSLAEGWRMGVIKSLERQFAPFAPSMAKT
jgi:NAD(P)-dependent dehydrogenase (short-subunit alcohol dehydrogenase family)